ncbi:MAG: hypothetical protein JJU03_04525 [Idiomarina sp.]|nr:hypothetical protein [Idiomarina sp.]
MQLTRVYGRNIQSVIQLPGFAVCDERSPQHPEASTLRPPVTLTVEYFSSPKETQREYIGQASKLYRAPGYGEYLFGSVAELGDFKLSENSVVLSPNSNIPEEHLLSFALGSGLGVQLYLQGIIPMHGMAFLNADGTASLVFGMSGAGKSTLAAACVSAGVPIFSDDILPIRQHQDEAYIYPAHRRLKISMELAAQLTAPAHSHVNRNSIEIPQAPQYAYPGTDKVGWVAPMASFANEPARISKCFLLRKGRCTESGKILPPIDAPLAMQTLRRCVYRPKLVSLLGLNTVFFQQAHQISSQSQFSYLQLPDRANFAHFQAYAQQVAALLA